MYKLNDMIFKGVKAYDYTDFQINDYQFEIRSQTNFKFRITFGVTHFVKQNRISLSVLAEQKFGDLWLTNGSSVTPTGTICKWVEDDFNTISINLIKEIKEKFPTADISINTISNFVNGRLREIQQNIA